MRGNDPMTSVEGHRIDISLYIPCNTREYVIENAEALVNYINDTLTSEYLRAEHWRMPTEATFRGYADLSNYIEPVDMLYDEDGVLWEVNP